MIINDFFKKLHIGCQNIDKKTHIHIDNSKQKKNIKYRVKAPNNSLSYIYSITEHLEQVQSTQEEIIELKQNKSFSESDCESDRGSNTSDKIEIKPSNVVAAPTKQPQPASPVKIIPRNINTKNMNERIVKILSIEKVATKEPRGGSTGTDDDGALDKFTTTKGTYI